MQPIRPHVVGLSVRLRRVLLLPKRNDRRENVKEGRLRPHSRLAGNHRRCCCRRFCSHLCRGLWLGSFVNVSSVAPMNRMPFPNLLKHPLKLLGGNTGALRNSVIRSNGATSTRFYGIGAEKQDKKRQTYCARHRHRRVPMERSGDSLDPASPYTFLQEMAFQMSKGCHFSGARQPSDVDDRLWPPSMRVDSIITNFERGWRDGDQLTARLSAKFGAKK